MLVIPKQPTNYADIWAAAAAAAAACILTFPYRASFTAECVTQCSFKEYVTFTQTCDISQDRRAWTLIAGFYQHDILSYIFLLDIALLMYGVNKTHPKPGGNVM